MDLSTMVTRVRSLVRDLDDEAGEWTDDEIEAAIAGALGEWSGACPDVVAITADGDGSSRTLELGESGPPEGYLFCLAVEYPTDEDPPRFVGFREVMRGTVIVRGDAPAAGTDNVRVYYAAAWSAANWTLPAEDGESIAIGTAAKLLEGASREAAGKLNASADTAAMWRKAAYGWWQDFHARLNRARARQVGPQWWTSWRADKWDV